VMGCDVAWYDTILILFRRVCEICGCGVVVVVVSKVSQQGEGELTVPERVRLLVRGKATNCLMMLDSTRVTRSSRKSERKQTNGRVRNL
jgi:hypothetical protein